LTEGLAAATGGLGDAGDSLGGLAQTGDALGGLAGALTKTVDSAAAPLGETVGGLTTPLTATLETATPALNDTIAGLGGPLTTTLDATTGPLSQSISSLSKPLTTTLDASEPAPGPSSGAGAGAGGGGSSLADGSGGGSPASPAQTVVDGTASTVAPTAADGASAFVYETAPGLGSFLGVPTPTQVIGGENAGSILPSPRNFLDSWPIADSPAAAGPDAPAVVAPASSPIADDSPLAAIAEVTPDPRVLVSAAVLAAVAGSLIGARGGPGGGPDMRMAFTNVRLMPCIVKAGLERQIETLSLAIARGGGAPASAGATALGGAVSGGPPASGGDGDVPARIAAAHGVADVIPKLFESAREGFDGVVRDAADEATDSLSDARLMTQIGMLFGFVYLGFLTVWFWATRVRRSLRI
jgi:hypothetical protein